MSSFDSTVSSTISASTTIATRVCSSSPSPSCLVVASSARSCPSSSSFPAPPPPPAATKLGVLSCVSFHPCHIAHDFFHPSIAFRPLFSHHFFGEREEISGYEKLHVRFFFIPNTFDTYVYVEGCPARGGGAVDDSSTLHGASFPSFEAGGESVVDEHGGGKRELQTTEAEEEEEDDKKKRKPGGKSKQKKRQQGDISAKAIAAGIAAGVSTNGYTSAGDAYTDEFNIEKNHSGSPTFQSVAPSSSAFFSLPTTSLSYSVASFSSAASISSSSASFSSSLLSSNLASQRSLHPALFAALDNVPFPGGFCDSGAEFHARLVASVGFRPPGALLVEARANMKTDGFDPKTIGEFVYYHHDHVRGAGNGNDHGTGGGRRSGEVKGDGATNAKENASKRGRYNAATTKSPSTKKEIHQEKVGSNKRQSRTSSRRTDSTISKGSRSSSGSSGSGGNRTSKRRKLSPLRTPSPTFNGVVDNDNTTYDESGGGGTGCSGRNSNTTPAKRQRLKSSKLTEMGVAWSSASKTKSCYSSNTENWSSVVLPSICPALCFSPPATLSPSSTTASSFFHLEGKLGVGTFPPPPPPPLLTRVEHNQDCSDGNSLTLSNSVRFEISEDIANSKMCTEYNNYYYASAPPIVCSLTELFWDGVAATAERQLGSGEGNVLPPLPPSRLCRKVCGEGVENIDSNILENFLNNTSGDGMREDNGCNGGISKTIGAPLSCKPMLIRIEIRECKFYPSIPISSSIPTTRSTTSALEGTKITEGSPCLSTTNSASCSDTFSSGSSAANSMSSSTSSISSSVSTSTFPELHRRMEWFLHWFIESASSIDHEERWRVVLPYAVLRFAVDDHNTNTGSEDEEHIVDIFESKKETIKKEKKKEKKEKGSASGGKSRRVARSLVSSKGAECSVPLLKRERRLPNKSRGRRFVDVYSLVGMATTYRFFTIHHDRRRVSQFLVYPHMQGKGMGVLLLEFLYAQALHCPTICEVTVEDPAPSFVQLRDVVSVRVAVQTHLLPLRALYPQECALPSFVRASSLCRLRPLLLGFSERGTAQPLERAHASAKTPALAFAEVCKMMEEEEKANAGRGSVSRRKRVPKATLSDEIKRKSKSDGREVRCKEEDGVVGLSGGENLWYEIPIDVELREGEVWSWDRCQLKLHTKETNKQASRMLEIVRLAQLLPHPLPPPPPTLLCSSSNFSRGRGVRLGASAGTVRSAPQEGDEFAGSAGLAGYRKAVKRRIRSDELERLSEISVAQLKSELEKEWQTVYSGYFRAIRKLRSQFPLD